MVNTQMITVMGLGYIGLPTASLLAAKGFKVCGCDVNPVVVDTINAGNIHIVEPELDILVRSAVNSRQLCASLTPKAADAFIIAVPTPVREDRSPDLSYVKAATQAIAPKLQPGNLVILESTSPVGTTEKIIEWLEPLRPDLFSKSQRQLFFAYCPERVLPGHVLRELTENDRIIGGIDRVSAECAKGLYQTFVQGEIYLTDTRTAEMSKLVENAYRDVNIAFANELSLICEDLEMNVWELIRLANHHPRVNILKPGPGVGGHCIAVDPWFIVDAAPDKAKLIRCAREINNAKPHHVVDKIQILASRFKRPKIGCLGLAFKPNIDDLRESPSVLIAEQLLERKLGELLIVEPHIEKLPKPLADSHTRAKLVPLENCLQEADIIVLLVDHRQFAAVKPEQLPGKLLLDTRGIWGGALYEASTY
jgi:UDP-N-acetyl-D-mannosaminuronic acid dehydrogenase